MNTTKKVGTKNGRTTTTRKRNTSTTTNGSTNGGTMNVGTSFPTTNWFGNTPTPNFGPGFSPMNTVTPFGNTTPATVGNFPTPTVVNGVNTMNWPVNNPTNVMTTPTNWNWNSGNSEFNHWTPPANVCEDDSSFSIYLAVPNRTKSDCQVTCDNNVLWVTGGRKSVSNTNPSSETCTTSEFSFGSFSRCFNVPDMCDTNKIKATCKNGVLCITIPKVSTSKGSNVRIS